MRPSRFLRAALRLGNAAQNALEIARFGGLGTADEPSPFDVVGRTSTYRLRHYFPALGGRVADTGRPPVLLVPPLMLTAEVYDVAADISGVAALSAAGVDPWVVDFGAPEREEGGLERTLADHVVAVSDAIDRVRRASGTDLHLGGYSQGGMFCYQTAAYRHGAGIRSLITFGSPVDISELTPAGLPIAELADGLATLAEVVKDRVHIPASLARRAFQMVDPLKTARQRLDFLRQLHNREALLAREGSRRFLERDGWVAWPGPAVADFARQFVAHNRMLSGGFVINGRLVTLADIDVPTLAVVGTGDEIAASSSVRAIRRAAPAAEVWELTIDAGHMGLVVGRGARDNSWPVVAEWVRWQEGRAARPAAVQPMAEDPPQEHPAGAGDGAEVVSGLLMGAAGVLAETAVAASRAVRGVLSQAAEQIPRLARLDRVDADTRVSFGAILQQRARRHGDDTFFLFQGRAHSYRAATARVDAITRGLIHVGVRQGERVGVLMGTRPTALALVAAISRLGAIAVMLRPDGDLAREIRLGDVSRVIADPEHAARVAGHAPDVLLVLGAPGTARDLPVGAVDMEEIDASAVDLPAWYRPDPGRARDVAMVLFTGPVEATRAITVTNRRWAASAYGTATAASLGGGDTVYAVSPVQHPATLLTAIGGAAVSGARLAVAPTFAPEVFWTEVRRYGVTVVSYTWTMCLALLEVPPTTAERHHPIRLFMGSGMPRGVWERVLDRFRPARVLEFYAPTDGDVVLAKVGPGKPGCMGRSLPGTAEVAVGVYDHDLGRLVAGPDGFVRRAAVDEMGMLLVRLAADRHTDGRRVVRGVFETDDVWAVTGDIFRRDADGDLWFLGAARSIIRSPRGPVPPVPVESALESVDAVALAAVHAITPHGGEAQLVVASLATRGDGDVALPRLLGGLSIIAEAWWPDLILLRDRLPLTSHHRIDKEALQGAGVGPDIRGWWLSPRSGGYEPVHAAALASLLDATRSPSRR